MNIRRANNPINSISSFYAAAPVSFNGIIGMPGTFQTQVVSNLDFFHTYYFAIRSKDMWGNWSLISNSPGGTSLAAPVVQVTPDSIHHDLMNNVTTTDSIDLKNNSLSPSSLNYIVKLETILFP